MQMHTVTECSNWHLNSITITKANKFKDLGVTIIYEKLKFKSQNNYHVISEASVRAFSFVTKNVPTLSRAFKTYVRPILEHTSCVWPYAKQKRC